jgi:ribosome biogenesis GTPase
MENRSYGKIIQGVGGLYTVRITDVSEGQDRSAVGQLVECRARGSFRHNNITPLPGDGVVLMPTTEAADAPIKEKERTELVIDAILERKNALIRPPMANLDYIFITMAAAAPTPVLSTVDKLICIAEYNKIEPVVVITKCELAPDYANELEAIYKKSGFTVFKVSAAENIDIDPIDNFIKENLPGRIAAFAGASGIGKSTLINTLFPHLSLETAEISHKNQRGRHTTRKVSLFPLSDLETESGTRTYLADTPGFSMLDFVHFDFFDLEDLPFTFPEFREHLGTCRYTKCTHLREDGCSIIEARDAGKIAKSRHESYVALYEILKKKHKWDKPDPHKGTR